MNHVHICSPDLRGNCCRAYRLWLTIRDLPPEPATSNPVDFALQAAFDIAADALGCAV